jgi:hypothetical protein
MFEYLGLALVAVTWLAGAYLVRKFRDPSLLTLSKHAASKPEAYRLFMLTLVICGVLFYVWLLGWFAPHLELGMAFTLLVTLVVFFQILAALIPDKGKKRAKTHRVAAYAMAVLYLPVCALIIASPELSAAARQICIFLTLYMLVTFISVVVIGVARSYYLAFQILYIMAFQAVILAAAYL